MKRINDFVVKFANVNGSGSASANLLFAKSLFRMGLGVVPKNIFPSNIQGLPTWYEVRVTQADRRARRGGVDIMVAMNPQTYARDLAEIVQDGYLIYDSSLPRPFPREDINVLGIPIARMCADAYLNPRERQLFKNVVYVGALTALLDMDFKVVKQAVRDRFKGKAKLVDPNIEALKMGRNYAFKHFKCPLPVRVKPGKARKDRIMITGNEAAALGCVYAGATVAAWYPITPSTTVAEAFERHAKGMRIDKDGARQVAVVQAEDELAAIGMVIGAAWNGARAFTATSGPGISLMGEFLGLAYFAEVPFVLVNVQRGGPSTGMPTRTQQSDITTCAYASHGDTKHVLLFPGDPKECFELTADAFDLAERLQTPVIVMSDLDLGMNEWVCGPLEWDDARVHDRGKVLDAQALDAGPEFQRYGDVDGDAIPYRTLPGTHPSKGAFFTRGSSHDTYAAYTEDGRVNAENLDRLTRKFATAAKLVPKAVIRKSSQTSKLGIINFGSTQAAVREACDLLARDGYKLNAMRLRAFPFGREVAKFAAAHDRIFVVEQNRDAQMRSLLITEAGIPAEKLVSVLNYDGMPLTPGWVRREIAASIESDKSVAAAMQLSVRAM
ncbi:MAG TPA: 2-oxoacid:acceptor oxidoreductase subunit alpha [Rhizobiales bacterium]|nr:2-oxoglutarate oxidoreductase subunit KorA [bacterium BMS3Bbin10]HDO51850.1 2-oxoacid:acceptor oxidoreductase subunit alpha [Hyphomicrobiales bacterium]